MPSNEAEDLDENYTTADDSIISRGERSDTHGVNEGKSEDDNREGNGCQDKSGPDEEEEEEEEDADFVPLLKESPSHEASSSLSSELDDFVADTWDNANSLPSSDPIGTPPSQIHDFLAGETDNGEEVTEHDAPPSPVDECNTTFSRLLHETSAVSFSNNCLANGEPKSDENFQNLSIKSDDDDAICKRTRARYSLASFTLDELETFLQETDDDDDLQNADEEVYRKFLAAVLLGGDDDPQNLPDNENVDDEDEENDADFELEIQEALESDVDEDAREEIQEKAHESRRPKTRQNRHKRTSVKGNNKPLAQSKRPLRPLLPIMPITQRAPFSAIDGKSFITNHASDFVPLSTEGCLNGFTPNQIRQLHCLIYEHVQLLIQIFSLSVLEPSRRQVASKVEELILELYSISSQVSSQRRFPYPNVCLFPPNVHSSVPDESSTILPGPSVYKHCSSVDLPRHCSSENKQNLEASSWMPYIDGPVFTVLDVAPLKLARKYIDDVSTVVKEYHQCQVRAASDAPVEREPLFPLRSFQVSAESSDKLTRESTMPLLFSESDQARKRSMASTLVEKAKKQSVAPVPKEIAKLAQTFYPLFNPDLYPHKPPPARNANRVLFTDAEDELLALGLMECNTDWEAIKRRFLPCKSKHQIFVRQKNRSSSKAPDNSIKAVRRMKSSPLTTEEVARIKEGLKIFKLDWRSIWMFVVPHRDPSMLPRQWRIAHGTQKLYKLDEATKARRRINEQRRRQSKDTAVAYSHSSSEKEDDGTETAREVDNGNDEVGKKGVAYVHEAFLADWRPHISTTTGTADFNTVASGEMDPIPAESIPLKGSQVGILLNSQPSTSNVPVARRHRARRYNHFRVVKLAPGLPPVNLPPSVRVMSQSTFNSYQGQLGKIPVNNHSNNQHQQQQHSVIVNNNKHAMEENEKELQMHPLLFQPPDNVQFPHYPNAVTSSSINFVSRSPPKLNMNLNHNHHSSTRPLSFLEKSSQPTSSFSFHPLLQKTDVLSYSVVNGQPNTSNKIICDSDSSKQRRARDSHVNISSPVASDRPVSPKEKNYNELELDIHLNFLSGRQEPSQGCTVVNEASMDRAVDTGKFDSVRAVYSNEALSFPEVIMEQEELSDSEDEIGEDVDFECEEMMDSDTDGSEYEQMAEDNNNNNNNNKSSVSTNRQIDNSSSSSLCLNLNSFPPASPFVENDVAVVAKGSTATNERLVQKDVNQQELANLEISRKRTRSGDSRKGRSNKRTSNLKDKIISDCSTPVSLDHVD